VRISVELGRAESKGTPGRNKAKLNIFICLLLCVGQVSQLSWTGSFQRAPSTSSSKMRFIQTGSLSGSKPSLVKKPRAFPLTSCSSQGSFYSCGSDAGDGDTNVNDDDDDDDEYTQDLEYVLFTTDSKI